MTKPPDAITRHFGLRADAGTSAGPRYNIAPTQTIPVVRMEAGERQLAPMQWGLTPSWSHERGMGARLLNARAETLSAKPAFRQSFRSRRCLIPADGFYEWQATTGKRKQPWYIHFADDELFAFGGIWDAWRDPEGATIESCAIVTTTPNDLLARVHDRMPLIVPPGDYEAWLSPEAAPVELLRPFAAVAMRMHPVATLVNSPANDRPECIAPEPEASPPGFF